MANYARATSAAKECFEFVDVNKLLHATLMNLLGEQEMLVDVM